MMRRLIPLLFLLAACGDDPDDPLQGDWVLFGDDAGLEQELRFDDGLVRVTMQLDGEQKVREYLYKVVGHTPAETVMDWTDRNGEAARVTARFEGERLHIDFAGEPFVFRRP